jgi:alcohol dehydrogenase YqhD (iron-dependent ADH family)
MPLGPIPLVVAGQPAKERLVAGEEFGERVQKQTFAKAPRAGEEVVLACGGQPVRKRGFVDVVVAALANVAEGLDADG